MITIPAFATLPHARLYSDSTDAQSVYVDLLQPAPVKGDSATRWMPIPNSLAYLVGEVRFGPGQEGFGNVPRMAQRERLLPMPWEIVPVFVWYRQGDGVQIVARGKTSGFGPSNAVFNGTAPLSAMVSPVLTSAELVCKARILGAQVNGHGNDGVVQEALSKAALGTQAAWDATLGDSLVEMLSRLLAIGQLTLEVKVDQAQQETEAERVAQMRELALLEWAHRIQVVMAPELTLATPAMSVKFTEVTAELPVSLAWAVGSTVTLRAVRVLRPKEMGRSVPGL